MINTPALLYTSPTSVTRMLLTAKILWLSHISSLYRPRIFVCSLCENLSNYHSTTNGLGICTTVLSLVFWRLSWTHFFSKPFIKKVWKRCLNSWLWNFGFLHKIYIYIIIFFLKQIYLEYLSYVIYLNNITREETALEGAVCRNEHTVGVPFL